MPMRPLSLAVTVVTCLAMVSCTPSVAPPAASPSAETTASASARNWPELEGEPGGTMRLNGGAIGRDGPESLDLLLEAMGPADEKGPGTCMVDHLVYRWGDVAVTVLLEEDRENEYGFSYPVGAIAGWRVDPTLDGKDGLEPPVTGPSGVTIGTPLSVLQTQFTAAEWDYADVETVGGKKSFGIFAGDTVGASFELDDTDMVSAMAAGYQCVVVPGR